MGHTARKSIFAQPHASPCQKNSKLMTNNKLFRVFTDIISILDHDAGRQNASVPRSASTLYLLAMTNVSPGLAVENDAVLTIPCPVLP